MKSGFLGFSCVLFSPIGFFVIVPIFCVLVFVWWVLFCALVSYTGCMFFSFIKSCSEKTLFYSNFFVTKNGFKKGLCKGMGGIQLAQTKI
jgi:hypothetical protein